MFRPHSTFLQPANENVRVWRYMDFTKLISLLDSKSLFFTRADRFDDAFEGSWPRINVKAREATPDDIPPEKRDAYIKAAASLGNIFKQMRKYTAINCWHMNDHESAAMWKLYLKSDEGIAVQSTYRRLRDSFTDPEDVSLGLVKYIDYDTDGIDASNLLNPYVHKRKSFEHEHEVRAVIVKWPPGESELNLNAETIGAGVLLKVDLKQLIERIYVAPSAPAWFADIVKSAVKRYGHELEIVHSRLNEDPLF